jgi:hypothetical protein
VAVPSYHRVRRWLGKAATRLDVDALSAVLLGGLVDSRRSNWTFGGTPAGVDDDRFLSGWADLWVHFVTHRRR